MTYGNLRCSECLAPVMLTRRKGRPRKTCSSTCSMARTDRLRMQEMAADRVESTRWWLSLTAAQRDGAMAWVRANPVPPGFRGGRQAWSWTCRAAFSCEGAVASGVGQ